MKNLRKYGHPPFTVTVVHGGPGAAGEMAPVAKQLEKCFSVLEPIQRATSLPSQVNELKNTIKNHASLPVTIVGFSWGAWLSLILTADNPDLIKKLILISSGPFEEKYVGEIHQTRLNRLKNLEKKEFNSILKTLSDPDAENKNSAFKRLGQITQKTDSHCPVKENSKIDHSADIFQGVWKDAVELRNNGQLLELAKKIKCPTVAIHGEYDPHPAQGVKEPLSKIIENFRFITMKDCGHKPWIERHAREKFFRILREQLQ